MRQQFRRVLHPYDEWHAKAKKLYDRPRWITVGSEEADPTILYAQDWVGDYCDNPGGLSRATALGYWNVIVDRPGIYEIELRCDHVNGPGNDRSIKAE